jgi:ElaB/YqjD/DUF883 family membrane-anchored ribosome-binding protein
MTKNRHHTHHNNYDLYSDFAKIRDAFAAAAFDAKGKASDMLTDSVDDLRKKSIKFKDQCADYTAERPFKTLGVTLLIGMAIGYFLHK